jgi:hypothetical protein
MESAQGALLGLPKNVDCPRPLHKPKLMRLALLISYSQNSPLGAEVLDAVGREKLTPEPNWTRESQIRVMGPRFFDPKSELVFGKI